MNTITYPPRRTGITSLITATPARAPAPDLPAFARRVVAALQALADRVRQARARAARRAAARDTYHLMRELDARTLRDLGIDRSELYSLALETHGEYEATRRLRGRVPDFPSSLSQDAGASNAFRF